jgi:PKD repeat protein
MNYEWLPNVFVIRFVLTDRGQSIIYLLDSNLLIVSLQSKFNQIKINKMTKKILANALMLAIMGLFFGQSKANAQTCHAHFTWHQPVANHLTFSDSLSTGTGPHTIYFWDFGDSHSGIGQNPTHGYSVPGTYTVCLTISDSMSSCHNTFCDTVHVSGILHCSLTARVHFQNASCGTCNDGSASITNILGGTPPYTYSWSPGGATTDTLSGLAPGTYTACVFDANGCHACNVVTISHSSPCSAFYTLHEDFHHPHNYIATNMSHGTGNITYTWNWGDGSHDSTATPHHTYSVAGLYTICLTISDPTGCTSTYCDTLTSARRGVWAAGTTVNVVLPSVTTSISEHTFLNKWNIFPNPSSGLTEISYTLNQNSDVRIFVYDLLGHQIIQLANTSNQTAGIHQVKLDGTALSPGVYFVRVLANSNVETKRLMIAR